MGVFSNICTGGETCLPAGRLVDNMYIVYAIASVSRKYVYVGLTNNLERRLSEHNSGYNKTTRPYRPFKLLYSEQCSDRKTARIREKYFKSGIGKERLHGWRNW